MLYSKPLPSSLTVWVLNPVNCCPRVHLYDDIISMWRIVMPHFFQVHAYIYIYVVYTYTYTHVLYTWFCQLPKNNWISSSQSKGRSQNKAEITTTVDNGWVWWLRNPCFLALGLFKGPSEPGGSVCWVFYSIQFPGFWLISNGQIFRNEINDIQWPYSIHSISSGHQIWRHFPLLMMF